MKGDLQWLVVKAMACSKEFLSAKRLSHHARIYSKLPANCLRLHSFFLSIKNDLCLTHTNLYLNRLLCFFIIDHLFRRTL
jgi:hypothetical protein